MTNTRLDVQLVRHPVAYQSPPMIEAGGGECAFLGRTRAETHDRHGPLTLLRYTAYESMALRVLQSLAQRALGECDARFVRIHHSLGEVPIGQASVFIQVVCGHRAEAFDACRMLIDRLKAEAPIWKSEVWADGTTWSRGQDVAAAVFTEDDEDEEEDSA